MLLLLLNMLCGNMYLVVLLFLILLFALSWVVHSRALSCLARFLSMLQMLPVPLMLVLTVALLSREVRPIVPFRLSNILGRTLLMLTFLLLRGLVHMHLLLDHGPFGHPLPPGHDNLVRFFPGGRGVPRATMDKSFRSKSCSLVSVKRPRSFIYNDGRSPSHLHGHSSSFPFPSSLGSPQEERPSRPAFPPSFLPRKRGYQGNILSGSSLFLPGLHCAEEGWPVTYGNRSAYSKPASCGSSLSHGISSQDRGGHHRASLGLYNRPQGRLLPRSDGMVFPPVPCLRRGRENLRFPIPPVRPLVSSLGLSQGDKTCDGTAPQGVHKDTFLPGRLSQSPSIARRSSSVQRECCTSSHLSVSR